MVGCHVAAHSASVLEADSIRREERLALWRMDSSDSEGTEVVRELISDGHSLLDALRTLKSRGGQPCKISEGRMVELLQHELAVCKQASDLTQLTGCPRAFFSIGSIIMGNSDVLIIRFSSLQYRRVSLK